MSKIGLVIKREYLRRVSKKSFLLLTFLSPFAFAALIFVPLWLATIKSSDVKQVMVVDVTDKYAPHFKDTEEYKFVIKKYGNPENIKEENNGDIFAFVSITGDLTDNQDAATIYSEKQIPLGLKSIVNRTLAEQIKNDKMAAYNIDNLDKIIESCKVNTDIKTFKWDKEGNEKNTSSEFASVLGMILTLVIYMFVMIYGAMVMQGVMEEKTNRIVEVMVSSVKPFDLMMGKIIGIGFVGLTQMFLWAVITGALVAGSTFFFGGSTPDAGTVIEGATMTVTSNQSEVNTIIQQALNSVNFSEIGICFVLYFIGGYLLYAAIFAAIGSALDQPEDSQQFMVPITLIIVFALYAGIYSMENPDGPLAVWCSMIPFTAPIVMMVRLPFDVPVWQMILSFACLYGTSIGVVWISAKIYRVGILMYGKKPSWKEMIKWLKYN